MTGEPGWQDALMYSERQLQAAVAAERARFAKETEIPGGQRGDAPYWRQRWLAALEMLDEEAAQRLEHFAAHRAEQDAIHDDLAHLLRVLRLGDHARPCPPHEVMQEAIAEVARLQGRLDLVTDREEAVRRGERQRILSGARGLTFTLWRPGNSPGTGELFDVVPLAELEKLIGEGP